jgi:hypothetical protein
MKTIGFKPFMQRVWLALVLSCLVGGLLGVLVIGMGGPYTVALLCACILTNLIMWYGYSLQCPHDWARWTDDGYARYAVPNHPAGWLIMILFAPAFLAFFAESLFVKKEVPRP